MLSGAARRAAHAADERRHPHVLAAPEGDARAEHREPHKQDGRQFVRPAERPVEHVAGQHAGSAQDDFNGQQRAGSARTGANRAFLVDSGLAFR